ncbi:MAG: response regulator [Bacteroidales bacterium]|mgnify:CR=1 FL=1|nr:response regulator [Bacteroidales bacterium]
MVDDEETSQQLFSIMIRPFASNYFQATNGHEAVEVCRQNPNINLILMDINMPIMSGYEATRQIRKFNKEVVIIAQTAYALSEDHEKAIKAGCNNYISKPIDHLELIGLINQYLS